ncbi:Bro-N domain-containing protein [uncultured Porphyromonas sp.]|uniref:BRO-N domain-containing protein n=1 Tax=uncultured Porphyromonas sp. TaxID=159274 RepID=UPI00266BE8ED|nr:Bro-N domain-containing protein [uncultured Porphyromonas sp.]
MFNNIDNRPAQTQNEPTPRPQLTELLQTTQLCGVSLSVYGTPAEPLFLAKEVAEILEIQSSRQMVQMVDEEEKLMYTIHTSGQARDTWMLTEQGLYEVLMQSRKPVARQFKAGVKALLKALRTGEQPATPAPSGTYLRRTARLMQSVSNQMHELRRRFAELDEASQMLATNRQEPTPIAGLDPIIMRGRVWYPLRGLLKSVTGSKDPKIDHYTERYPDRTMVYYQMSYCDEALARYIVAREELRQRQEALTAPLFDNL